MAKNKVKSKSNKKPIKAISTLEDLDNTISKVLKNMDASINISMSTHVPTQPNPSKKKTKKKVKKK